MILGSDGNFYGTTCGTASVPQPGRQFLWQRVKLTPGGILSTIYTFTGGSDGNCPTWESAEGPDSNFYSVTTGGNPTTPYGTIFKLTPGGSLTGLYAFYGTVNFVRGCRPRIARLLRPATHTDARQRRQFIWHVPRRHLRPIVQMTPAAH